MVELRESIEKFGIRNPLIIWPVPDGCYEITSGHRSGENTCGRFVYRIVIRFVLIRKNELKN
jgi:hypothetical protein